MSERTYTEAEIISATHAATAEVYGHDTMSAGIITGKIATHLAIGASPEAEVETVNPNWDQSPDYAVRALGARSTIELIDLLTDAAQRLDRSAATYVKGSGEESWRRLTPWVMAEGSEQGEIMVGRLHVSIGAFGSWHSGVSIRLQGGKDAPYDQDGEEKNPSHLVRSLDIKSTTVKDPVTGEHVTTFYPEIEVRYDGMWFSGADGKLFEARKGAPLGAYGRYVIADLFSALDSTITYYETVYSQSAAGNGHIGLTYNDFKTAGCLNDDLYIDREKANAYAGAVWSAAQDDPELVLPFERKLVLDSKNRALIEEQKSWLRATIAVSDPRLLSIS